MNLQRSESAKVELASRERVLNVRERGALFLADGQRTRQDVQALLKDDGSILEKLIGSGYLLVADARPRSPVASPAPALPTSSIAEGGPNGVAPPANSADGFDGKRSLATTRMFLFDICERMFVRKLPAMANHYRDQLREARDRESMVAIARDIILNVEELAGAERADGLRERIAMLLPPDH